jgi:glyoxylase-like metal-dependent hydrolase (beta-lactamase superfamily II)
MADYLASLDKVIDLPYRRYVPAHGGDIKDGPAHARVLKQHRLDRNAQVVAAIRGGASTVRAIVAEIYPSQPMPVRRAARMTISAHVEYLADQGLVTLRRTPLGLRISG